MTTKVTPSYWLSLSPYTPGPPLRGDARADVDPTAATFFLLGALNWVYQWYKVDGPLSEEQLATELISLFTKGFLTRG